MSIEQNKTLAAQCTYRYRETPMWYVALLERARLFIGQNCSSLLNMGLGKETNEYVSQLTPYIEKFLEENKPENISGYSSLEELIDDLRCEFQFSVLTKPLFEDGNVEKINAVSYDNIRVTFNDGSICRIRSFLTPDNALDIIKTIPDTKNKLDAATPILEASRGNKIRITAMQQPVIRPEDGVSFSIRKLSDKVFTKKEYIERGFINDEQYDFLVNALRYGVSILVCGIPGTGKTTVISSIGSMLPENKKIFVIENGAREINLKDKFSVHTLTRAEGNESVNIIDETWLIKVMLRYDTNIGIVGEMRSTEAQAAIEGTSTGVPIFSSLHAGGAEEAHDRMADLYRQLTPIDYHSALIKAAKSFPIIVYVHQGEDYRRRITSITEAVVTNNEIEYNPLFGFDVTETRHVDGGDEYGSYVVEGNFERYNPISKSLKAKLQGHGAPKHIIQKLCEEVSKKERRVNV